VPEQAGQDRERIEVCDAFDRFALMEHYPIHVAPFDDVASDTSLEAELDEYQVPVSAPLVDFTAQVGKATTETVEFGLCRLDPDHRSSQRLREDDFWGQEFR